MIQDKDDFIKKLQNRFENDKNTQKPEIGSFPSKVNDPDHKFKG